MAFKVGDRVYFARGWGIVVAKHRSNVTPYRYTVRLEVPTDYEDNNLVGKEFLTYTVTKDITQYKNQRKKTLDQ